MKIKTTKKITALCGGVLLSTLSYAQTCTNPPNASVIASGPSNFCVGGSVALSAKVDTAIHFYEANSQYVDLHTSSIATLTNDFTMEAWIRTTGTSEGVINKSDGHATWNGGESALYIDASGMPAYVEYENGHILSTKAVNDGTWHHIALVWDGANNAGHIYVDGIETTSSSSSYNVFDTDYGTFYLGEPTYSTDAPNFFGGDMKQIRIWTAARSQSQIQANMNVTVAANSANLAAYYQANEGTGAVLGDVTANAYNGDFTNGVTWTNASTFSWNNGATTNTFTVSTSGSYVLTVTDANGCSNMATQNVVENLIPTPSVLSNGATTFCSGNNVILSAKIDTAINFNGVNQYVDMQTGSIILTNDFTMETWVRTVGTNIGVINKSDGHVSWNGGESAFYIDANGMPAYVEFMNGHILSTQAVNDGTWHHIALVWDGANNAGHIYVDGVETTSPSTSYNVIDTDYGVFYLGQPTYSTDAPNFFSGDMKQVRIWTAVRTQSQIQTNMNVTIPANSANLAVYYIANEGTGSVVHDATNTNVGNFDNGVSWTNVGQTFSWSNTATTSSVSVSTGNTYAVTVTTAAGCSATASQIVTILNSFPAAIITASGPTTFCAGNSVTLTAKLDTAIHFNGANQYVDMQTGTIILTDPFTMETWVRTTGTSEGVINKSDGHVSWNGGESAFYIDANGMPAYIEFMNGHILSTQAVNDGTWHHIALVWDGAAGHIYVDGADKTSPSTSYNVIDTDYGVFYLGEPTYSTDAPNFFSGDMKQVRIWTTARTQVQIQANMNVTIPANSSNLAVYYIANEASGNVVHDATNSNVGTFNNGVSWTNANTFTWSNAVTTPSFSTTTTDIYTLTVTGAGNCVATATQTVTVNPLPVISFSVNPGACIIDPTVTLQATPAGGTYSGTGVTGNDFSPAVGVGTYTITYAYTDVNGCSSTSSSSVTVIDCTTGISKMANGIGSVNLYPNPSNGAFTIATSNIADNTTLVVYNAMGQVVYTQQISKQLETVNTNLANGFYTLKIQNSQGVSTQRIVIEQ